MNILTVCGIALITVAAAGVIRELRPSLTPFITAAAGVLLLGYTVVSASPVIEFIKALDTLASGGITVMIKGLGIAVSCQLTSEICRDCGETNTASRVELAGKIGILLLSLPLVRDILQIAGELVN